MSPIQMPGGEGGIGFDDMGFSAGLGKVIAPSGRTGKLNLVDPKTRAIDSIGGFTTGPASPEGHGEGTTSADYGAGFLFASDRNAGVVDIVDPAAKKIVGSAKLAGGPDYVRWVAPLNEVWVTEPRKKMIEIFKFEAKPAPKLSLAATLQVDDGPESLVVDAARGRAYTHTWKDETMVIELSSRDVKTRWKNGCEGSRGIALDEKRALLFVGCDEGKATALDVTSGKVVGTVAAGKGVDIIAYAPATARLYVPGGDDANLTVVAVGEKGQLTAVGKVPTAKDAHCAAADAAGNVYVCDPGGGRLLVMHDEFKK